MPNVTSELSGVNKGHDLDSKSSKMSAGIAHKKRGRRDWRGCQVRPKCASLASACFSLAYTLVKCTFPSSYLVLSLFSAFIHALSFAWKCLLLLFEARLKCHPFSKISFRSPPWGEEGGLNFPSSVIQVYICSSI